MHSGAAREKTSAIPTMVDKKVFGAYKNRLNFKAPRKKLRLLEWEEFQQEFHPPRLSPQNNVMWEVFWIHGLHIVMGVVGKKWLFPLRGKRN